MIKCTIIIPHHNQLDQLKVCLTALSAQEGGLNEIEVIVVDSGQCCHDIESCKDIISEVVILYQDQLNPYISRNLAISMASNAVVAFLDASCQPDRLWLVSGLQAIEDGSDVVGGQYVMTYKSNRISERVHGILYLNNLRNALHHRGFSGGNLFIRKKMFTSVGLFGINGSSGHDIAWTRKAQNRGYQLRYVAQAKVLYPSKSYLSLLKSISKYAVGVAKDKQARPSMSTLLTTGFLPMRPDVFVKALNYRHLTYQYNLFDLAKCYLFCWRAKVHYSYVLATRS